MTSTNGPVHNTFMCPLERDPGMLRLKEHFQSIAITLHQGDIYQDQLPQPLLDHKHRLLNHIIIFGDRQR